MKAIFTSSTKPELAFCRSCRVLPECLGKGSACLQRHYTAAAHATICQRHARRSRQLRRPAGIIAGLLNVPGFWTSGSRSNCCGEFRYRASSILSPHLWVAGHIEGTKGSRMKEGKVENIPMYFGQLMHVLDDGKISNFLSALSPCI